jgi:hypothetical protein
VVEDATGQAESGDNPGFATGADAAPVADAAPEPIAGHTPAGTSDGLVAGATCAEAELKNTQALARIAAEKMRWTNFMMVSKVGR